MIEWQKLRKFTYRRELELIFAINTFLQLVVLILYFGWNVPFQIALGLVSANLLIYFVQIYRLRKKNLQFDKFLNKRYKRVDLVNYLTSLDEFKSSLISLNEPEEVAKMTCKYTGDILNSSKVSIYLWDEKTGTYHSVDDDEQSKTENFFYVYDPFILWISDNPKVMLAYDLEILLSNQKLILEKGKEFFQKTNSKIVVPLVLNKGLLGILTIGEKKSGDYTYEDFDHLTEIVEVSIMSLSNSIFYKQLISITENLEAKVKERTRALEETQSQLVMSEKMASLGVMVAGIAHEINTPAGVINAASDNLNENIMYAFKNVNKVYSYLNNSKLRKSFRKIVLKLLKEKSLPTYSSTEKFRLKREYKSSFLSLGLNEKDASDASNFTFENSIPELIQDIAILYQAKAYPLIDVIHSGVASARNIKNIKYSIKNIVRIVKALKYYSHLDQSSYGEADIIESLENTLIILNNQIKHGVEVFKDYDEIPLVYCNLDELNQVWTNLINNALHAIRTSEHPKITISTKKVKLAGNLYVTITIQDNGTGIPPEIIDRIWDPFFTTKDQGEGSGLGLGIVKGIIDKHKGTIKVESKPGDTKFIVYLPVEPPVEKV